MQTATLLQASGSLNIQMSSNTHMTIVNSSGSEDRELCKE